MALVVTNLAAPASPPSEGSGAEGSGAEAATSIHPDTLAALAGKLSVAPSAIRVAERLLRSLDARPKKPVWRENYRVELDPAVEAEVLARRPTGVRPWTERDRLRRDGPAPAPTRWAHPWPVVVIGAGPAGLFAALRLGEAGVPVVLVDRGGPVEHRVPAVNAFWRGGPLDPENNLLFGEGGAGTFSDGKIYTRRRDGELGYIFRVLVEAGADPGILSEAYAHLGTDKVRAILPKLRERLASAGVAVHYHTRLHRLEVADGRVVGVHLVGARGDEHLATGRVIVAAGHSARDTMALLIDAGVAAELRPIAIGARVEHPQALIDAARYGMPRGARPGELPPASYRLTCNPPGGRSAYTFCMCPGGMVVPANHAPGEVVVNGMSFSARRAVWANAAVIVQVFPSDYPGADPMAGVRFQEAIERAAYAATGGFAAPAQRVSDFLAGVPSQELPRTSYPLGVAPVDLRALLPRPVVEGMATALRAFDASIAGFAGRAGVLIAPQTRTTAPLRFLRGPDLQSPSLRGLLPVGEGAGYAGGIISAALDGTRAAEALLAEP